MTEEQVQRVVEMVRSQGIACLENRLARMAENLRAHTPKDENGGVAASVEVIIRTTEYREGHMECAANALREAAAKARAPHGLVVNPDERPN